VNEQNKTVAHLWDGVNMKCTFRRCVDVRLFNLWEELVNLVTTIELSSDEDALAISVIWSLLISISL
jgi:hypothetical protein